MAQNTRSAHSQSDSNWMFDPDQQWDTLRITRSVGADIYTRELTEGTTHNRVEHTSEQTDHQLQRRERSQGNVTADDDVLQSKQEGADGLDNIGYVSDEWKKAASCLVLGSVTFLLAVLAFLAFSMTLSNTFLYAIGGLTFLYGALRLGFSYYIYKDAKLLAYHSRERRGKPWTHSRYGWTPSAFLWGFITFTMPPFIEYAPAAMYFIRRHQRTSVP